MRKDRANRIKKERMVMLASSALVMGALTMTGIYMKEQSVEKEDEGYSIDFGTLEENVDEVGDEYAQNNQNFNDNGLGENLIEQLGKPGQAGITGEIGDDSLAAGSPGVEIPGLTDKPAENTPGEQIQEKPDAGKTDAVKPDNGEKPSDKGQTTEKADKPQESIKQEQPEEQQPVEQEPVKHPEQPAGTEPAKDNTGNTGADRQLHFAPEEGLAAPAKGEVLMHYSMDGSIYFATLDQYKYNPAVMFSAAEGDEVIACADGKVLSVFSDAKQGLGMIIDLGDGYQAVYGQLKDLKVGENAYVTKGQVLGSVAAPTKYYTLEGTNLYFRLMHGNESVNPEPLFQ